MKILPILTCSSDPVAENKTKQLDFEWNLSWWLDFHGFVWLVEANEKVDYIAKFYGSNVAFETEILAVHLRHTTYLVENAAKKGVGQQTNLEEMCFFATEVSKNPLSLSLDGQTFLLETDTWIFCVFGDLFKDFTMVNHQ